MLIIVNLSAAGNCPQQDSFVVEDVEELKDLLIRVGGTLNPRLVAVTLKDAQNFPDLVSKNQTFEFDKLKSCQGRFNTSAQNDESEAGRNFRRSTSTALPSTRCYPVRSKTDKVTKIGSRSVRSIRLCSQCSTARDLGEGFFPRYINEVTCDPKEIKAPFPVPKCFKGEGLCQQREQSYAFFKNIGQKNYQTFNVNIRVSCECELQDGSGFAELL